MLTVSHGAVGIVVLCFLHLVNSTMFPKSLVFVILAVLFAMFPDVDGTWSKSVKDHHLSLLHAPLFWLLVGMVFYFVTLWGDIVPGSVLALFLVQVSVHVGVDYVTGRTAGIALWYPFSQKQYSVFRLRPEIGDFSLFRDARKRARFLVHWFDNKILVAFEGGMWVLAPVLWVIT